MRMHAAPLDADRIAEQAHALRAHVAGDEEAAVAHVGGHRHRLSAWRRAQVEHPLAGPRAGRHRDELRRLVLDEERSVRGQAQRIAGRDVNPSGA